ncbi:hypothetical protein SAMN04487939_101859 [Lysobacter sp. yr284]|uniref:hypothetical protein n=1 Tax=Lysobacter TaxID=68 RepID=UPI000899E87C|nr:hypothetical protein [Lysobacter sp. yr284]SDY32994.1 hypothetical protein SAMN04487939_101859 [Lysobacter sp. yr284]
MHRLICSFAIVLAGIAFSGTALAQSCPGKLVGLKPIKNPSGQKLAELQLYYDANSGKNCARTMHSSATWGQNRHTTVLLQTCKQENFHPRNGCSKPLLYNEDWGNRKYQAGPVSVAGENRCVFVQGGIVMPVAGGQKAYRVEISGHCG